MSLQDKYLIFSEDAANELPLGYHFLTRMATTEVPELRVGQSYSKSKLHFANEYINFRVPKPISNVFIDINFDNDCTKS